MLFAIDIDGTIANPEPTLIAFHNQDFAPGFTAKETELRSCSAVRAH